jgi:hypothetical protein
MSWKTLTEGPTGEYYVSETDLGDGTVEATYLVFDELDADRYFVRWVFDLPSADASE